MGPNNFLNFIRQKIFHAHKAHSILINENIQTKKVSKWWSVFKYSCVAAVGCAGMATATISIGGSTWDPIRAIANTGAEGVENKYYLDLVVPEKTDIEQYSEYVVQAVGNDWMHRRVEWSIESVSTLEGVEYRTEGKKNEFFIIKNNLNSFYSKDFKITAYVSVIIASADLVCVGKTKDDFRDRNKPIVAEPVILTEEESYAKTYSGLSELFATKSSVALDELNYIQYNPELSVQEKIDKTNELCVTKHINLIDHNTFEKYKEEFIQSSYDEILNTDLITDEQKLEYIGLLTKQIDETFTEIQEQNFITNSELSKYLNDYYLNISQDFSNVSPKMFSASSENKTEEIKENILKNNLAEFSNSNKIVLSNSNVFAEDIINEQFELDEDFSLKNTNYLNNFFQFNDYFGNKTQNLNDSVYNIDILTKISNIEEFENSLNFNLEYKFDLENSEAQFFNFELGLKFPKQQPVVDIDTFFNDHSFSLNKDYGWDNVEENYWDKMFEYQLQENDKNFSFDFDDDGHHITTWRDEDILFWYDHWWNNITSYLKSMNISLDFNENKIDGATIDNIDN
ncbi:MAG: hypothetical protein LBH55_03230, partial [Mycoplasmataceae bacterium]|nr:hypothetical protein [Mycoplasmataceae bacterium]